jgi:hypothetical protein
MGGAATAAGAVVGAGFAAGADAMVVPIAASGGMVGAGAMPPTSVGPLSPLPAVNASGWRAVGITNARVGVTRGILLSVARAYEAAANLA